MDEVDASQILDIARRWWGDIESFNAALDAKVRRRSPIGGDDFCRLVTHQKRAVATAMLVEAEKRRRSGANP